MMVRLKNESSLNKRLNKALTAGLEPQNVIQDEIPGIDGTVVRVRDEARVLLMKGGTVTYQYLDLDTVGTAHRINWTIPYLNFNGAEEWPIVTPEKLLMDERGIFNVLKSSKITFENLHDYPLEVSINVPMCDKTAIDKADPSSRSQASEFKLPPKATRSVRFSYSPEVMGEYRFCETVITEGKVIRQYAAMADFLVKGPKYSDAGTLLRDEAVMVAVTVSVDSYCTTLSDMGHVETAQGTQSLVKLEFRPRFVVQAIKPSMVHMIVPQGSTTNVLAPGLNVVLSPNKIGAVQNIADGTIVLKADTKSKKIPLAIPAPAQSILQIPALSICCLTNESAGNAYEHASFCSYRRKDAVDGQQDPDWYLWDFGTNAPMKAYNKTLILNQFEAPASSVVFVVTPGRASAALALGADFSAGLVGLTLSDVLDGITRTISILGHLSALISLF